MTDWRKQVCDYVDRLSKWVHWGLPPEAEDDARAASEAMRRLLGRLGALYQHELNEDRALAAEAERTERARVAELEVKLEAAQGRLLDELRTLFARPARAEGEEVEGDR